MKNAQVSSQGSSEWEPIVKTNIVDEKLLKEQVKKNIFVRIVEESHEDFLNEHEDGRQFVNAKNAKCFTLIEKKYDEDLMFCWKGKNLKAAWILKRKCREWNGNCVHLYFH